MSGNERASVEFNGRLIEYTVVRSARRKKTIEIMLDAEHGVLVRSPMRTTRKDIAEIVQNRAGWILNHATEDVLNPTPRRFRDGETLLYLGEQLPIVASAALDGRVSVSFEDGAFHIATPPDVSGDDRTAAVKEAAERWYRREATRLLPEIVARWQSKVSRKIPTRVLIRNQRRRWGSCSSDGSIRLNWRIVMAETALIDYVVVHELAHLAVMNHSSRYWQKVESAMPDYRIRRKRLNEMEARFWL